MLVLTRKSNECIRIGHTISVTVLAIQGSTVKLGLSGPPDVSFQREEVYQRIRSQDARLSSGRT